jgi:hypothetical protein
MSELLSQAEKEALCTPLSHVPHSGAVAPAAAAAPRSDQAGSQAVVGGRSTPSLVSTTSSIQQLAEFDDIGIVTLDEKCSHKPDPDKTLYQVYLVLSASPPSEWQHLFDEVRQFPRHIQWRQAWIEGQYLLIRCPLEELETHHLQDLKADLQTTNTRYRQLLLERAQAQARRQQQERDTLTTWKQRLSFG